MENLLLLSTPPREDSATSASEAVYGSVLTLPGQFLEVQDPPTNLFYENHKNSMSGFQPTPPCHNTPAADTLPEVTPAELSSNGHQIVQWFLYVRMDMLLL